MHLFLKLLSSPWFWLDVVLSMSGGIVVYWGLRVEKRAEELIPPSEFKPDLFEEVIETQKKEIERGWRILMVGIVMEVIAALGISIMSGLEIADLTDKAEQTRKDAADTRLLAASVEQTNIVLRSNLNALVLKIQPRIITPEQVTNFIFLTDKIKKIPITVSIGQEGFDTESYAFQLRTMLSQAGFGTNDSAGTWGITRDNTRLLGRYIGTPSADVEVVFVVPSKAILDSMITNLLNSEVVNGITRPVVVSTNDAEVYHALHFVFQKLNIQTRGYASEWTPPRTFEIFVPMKSQF